MRRLMAHSYVSVPSCQKQHPWKGREVSEEQQPGQEKEVAYFSAIVDAWVETRMEKDRALLGLSTGGVGLLATLLTTVGVARMWQLILYSAGALAFGFAIVTAIRIFGRNAE